MEEIKSVISVENETQSPRPWPKVLFSVLGLFLAGGVALAAIQISKKQTSQIAIRPTPTLTLVPIVSPTALPEANPPSDETAKWETFRGQSFSFRYPGSWKLDQSNTSLTTSRPTSKKAGGDYTPGMGWISFVSSNNSLQEVIDSLVGVDKKEEVIVNGYPVTKLTGHTGVAGSVYFVKAVFNNNGKAFTIDLSTQDTDLEKPLTIEFDQILSTFKSLD
jgi:hypothetical protein